jgi:5-methylcytosine-specific restriction endonuclease McrA
MTTSNRESNSSDGVVCPACGKQSPTHRGYAIHYSKSKDDEHTGTPTVARFGEDRLIGLYWDHDYEEIADILGVGSTTVFNAYDELDLPKKTEYNRVAWEHGVSKTRLAYHLHYDAKMTTTEMATALDVSRRVIDKLFEKSDAEPRSQGEAASLAFKDMSEAERAAITESARERHREKYGDGGYISEWVRENPERHAEVAKENAHKGAPAREKNGMAGVTGEDHPRYNRVATECANCGDTIHRKRSHAAEYDELYCGRACQAEHRSERFTGQDHPNWRGGKSLIDAVKKQLRPAFSAVREECRGQECQKCGSSDARLDVHHIVPVSAGGTNEDWNLITLCRSCHGTAEAYTRDLPGMGAVLCE